MCNTSKHLFGPVISRRYGRSLGVDMVPPKSCPLNCIFCQLGATQTTAVMPVDKPDVREIIDEIKCWIDAGGQADIITLAGSGEPTLHRHFGEVLLFIKQKTDFNSLLLSNGALFFKEEVRRQATDADVVKLSLHAWDQTSFERVTRADKRLKFKAIIDGYQKFRGVFNGRIDVEVFVIPGINDTPSQMRRIAAIAQSFAPDSIFLNTAVRPPASAAVQAASPMVIAELTALFGEVATRSPLSTITAQLPYSDEQVIRLTARHPTSINQLAGQFNISEDRLHLELTRMKREGVIAFQELNGEVFITHA